MSTSQFQTTTTDAIDVPDDLQSAESKLVYLSVNAADGATVDELHESLGIRKISLFPVLDTLSSRDHVDRDGDTYVPA